MDLFDILACPNCKVKVERRAESLICLRCGQSYPLVHGVPVMFPDGSIPQVVHEAELLERPTYDPWVHRSILQSLTDDQIVLDVGSGNVSLDDPNIIRMDITLTPYVDLVADLHALPFLPGSVDYIFSLAVFEHLRNPFEAAQSIYETLKDGGYIYHECNFIYAYHGFPHHYFNASLQGMEQVFGRYKHLRKGVATYQMPSFALDMILRTYLAKSHAKQFPHGQLLVERMQALLSLDLPSFDIYFSEAEAQYVAAGVYLSGYKQESPSSSLVPAVIRNVLEQRPDLQARFPDPNDLSTVNNLMIWAQQEGSQEVKEIAQYLRGIKRFNKRGAAAAWDRSAIRSMPLLEAKFGAIGYDPDATMSENSAEALRRFPAVQKVAQSRMQRLWHITIETVHKEGLVAFLRKALRYFKRKLVG